MLQKKRTVIHLAPPHSHRINAVELAIRTFKNRFVAVLAPVDKNYPIYLWFLIAKQAEITINILRKARTNPILSTCAQIFGTYDFNAIFYGTNGYKNHPTLKTKSTCYTKKTWSIEMVYRTSVVTIQVLKSICDRKKSEIIDDVVEFSVKFENAKSFVF